MKKEVLSTLECIERFRTSALEELSVIPCYRFKKKRETRAWVRYLNAMSESLYMVLNANKPT